MNKYLALIFFVFILQAHKVYGQQPSFGVNITENKLESITVIGVSFSFKNNRLLSFASNDSSVFYREFEKLFVFYGIYIGPKNDSILQLQFEGNVPVMSYKNYRKVLEPSDVKPFVGTIDTLGKHGFVYGWDKSDVRINYNNADIEKIEINKSEKKFEVTLNKSKKNYEWDITYYMEGEFLFVYNHEKSKLRGMLNCKSQNESIENSIDVYFKDGFIREVKRYFEKKKDGSIPVHIIKYNKKGEVIKVTDLFYSSVPPVNAR